MSEIHPFALDLHHLHPCLGHRSCSATRALQGSCDKAGAGGESLSASLGWCSSPAVCESSHCSLVTPDLAQSKNKNQFICQKMPFLRQADGWGKVGNKEKE